MPNPTSIPNARCLSTRRGRTPGWVAPPAAARGRAAAHGAAPWSLEDDHARGRPVGERHRCAHGRRPGHQPGPVRGVCRTGPDTGPDTGRHRRHGQSFRPQGQACARVDRCRRPTAPLPPYGPDFSPVENAIAQIKAHLGKAAKRTVDGLWDRIGEVVDLVTPQHARNYFAACGYEPT